MKKCLPILLNCMFFLYCSTSIAAYNDIIPSQIVPPLDTDLITGDTNSGDILPERTEPVREGKLLYENHCKACHDSTVHIRNKRRVRSLNDIRYWVQRWSSFLNLNWSQNQREQVTDFLNQRYYQFPNTPLSN